MKTSENGLKKIIGYEGKLRSLGDGRYIAYRCPANVSTIYAGCTEGVHDGMIITEAEGEEMFAREIAKFEAGVERLVKVPLNQNEFDALVSFAYNCGLAALGRSKVLKLLNRGDRTGAAKAFHMWNKGGGRVLPGLVSRRASEAALFLKPIEQPAEPYMPQAVTPSPEKVSRPTVAVAAGTVVAAAPVVTPALPSLPSLPVPSIPAPVSESISNVGAWNDLGEKLWTLKDYALAHPQQSIVVSLLLAAVWLGPGIASKVRGA